MLKPLRNISLIVKALALSLLLAALLWALFDSEIASQLVEEDSYRRAILALTLILFFTLFVVSIASRIKQLRELMHKLLNDYFGITSHHGGGDEIYQLEEQFKQLANELELACAEDKLLHGKILDRAHESRSLRLVTELLSVGVVVDAPQGVINFNKLMKSLAADFDGSEMFLLGDKQHAEIHLTDVHNNLRSFTIDHHAALGPRGGFVREITARVHLEKERDLFANFPLYNPNPLMRVERKGHVLYTNNAMQELMKQLNLEQIDSIPDEWLQKLDQHIADEMKSDMEIMVGERTYAFVAAPLESGVSGGKDSVYLFGQDITEKREAERKMELASTVNRSILDGIMITDINGVIQQLNPAFSDILGYGESDLIGKLFVLIYSSQNDDALLKQMWSEVKHNGSWQGELWSKHKDGSTIFCSVRMNAIHDDSGQISNYVAVYSDITERKRHEEWLTHQAFHDPLTRLPNRNLLEDLLSQDIARAQHNHTRLAVLYLGIDGFKLITDRFDQHIIDQLFCEIAERLRDCVRSSDTVSRISD
ncbi:MAG: PAS domain S-box protein, partial [Gammaproteobacteria bacterium]|nr:PAS domain S-box protein [Gammaproteobacteria bacterium]